MKSSKKLTRVSIVVLGLVVVGLGVMKFLRHSHHHHHGSSAKTLIQPEGFGKVDDFQFTNQKNIPIGLKELKGSPWVANFIFTRCAGPCPIMTTKMAQIQERYVSNPNLKFVSFSVDPDYDKPNILAQYAKQFGADSDRWHFLTGARDKIYSLIRNSFKLAVQESIHMNHGNDMEVLHSLHFVLVDKLGGIKGYFNSNDPESMKELNQYIQYELNPSSQS